MNDERIIKDAWNLIVNTSPDPIPYSNQILRQNIIISAAFKNKKVYDYQKKFIYVFGKGISKVAILIVVLILLTSSFSAYAIYQVFTQYVREKNTNIELEPEQIKDKISDYYYPAYLPNGFKKIEEFKYDDEVIIHYTDEISDIFYRQELSQYKSQIDNEETLQESIEINGKQAIYIEKHGEKLLIYDQFGYVFCVDSNSVNVTKDELIKIVNSIEKESE